jgi:hypothetical protein
MAHHDFSTDWHSADSSFEHQLTYSTHEPGVYSSATSDLPERLHHMNGLASADFSYYASTREAPNDMAVYGEMAAIRTEVRAETTVTKAYIYPFGMSSDGHAYFNGPYTDSDHHHHYPCSTTIAPSDLFGFVPYPETNRDA